ncbi:hypothetical protein RJ55_01105 [Drechmeria coniospora]|nr:hypothetical protein RJ55_01105 [Drechmeria coniospora]
MVHSLALVGGLAALLTGVLACGDSDSCYGPTNAVEHVRQVKRMQPGVPHAAYGPKGPLEWGQVNFLHTTDTHGWLEGHLKEKNYGADWGDFVTFTRRMKRTAAKRGVDLLLIDTGDLHDGNGLSDATPIDGTMSMPIFDELEYDLLTIGNHELYVSEVSYQMFNEYARRWGDRYITSNVKVLNKTSGQHEYVGKTHRYFTTRHGLRVMAFGVLFDFVRNSNASIILKAQDMIKEPWFLDALTTKDPIDMFILFGHNPAHPSNPVSTFKLVFDEIRKVHPKTPIQIFGGHSHVRDFAVYDESSVAIASGRYCETLGWVSMTGFDESNSAFDGSEKPRCSLHPSRPALDNSTSPFLYSRRYLDWNRKTFIYHSNSHELHYDRRAGKKVTDKISKTRHVLKLGDVAGCAPQDWCMSCAPMEDLNKNIYTGLMSPAMSAMVVNKTRADKPRIILANTGAIRFDLHKGPFTYDDNFIVSPFRDVFLYIPDVPFKLASQVIRKLNLGPVAKRELASMANPLDSCTDPSLGYLSRRDMRETRGVVRRQEIVVPGYTTTDDWGTDGDDTEHSEIPSYEIPPYWETRASFPDDGSDPETVDLVFFDFIEKLVLNDLGAGYTHEMVQCYVDCNFSSQDFMLPYARLAWSENKDNCPVM